MSSEQLCSTTCPYCGVGCGVEVTRSVGENGKVGLTAIGGQTDHPANFGRLCVKGTHLLETCDNNGRLAAPQIHNETVDWPKATQFVADKLSEAIQEFGPDSVAFYVSGQLLTEDYYVANKLMKGFIGSANIDTNSRLCMSSAVAAYKRAFGSDSVPCCYEDIDCADLVILTGSNAAWTHPVLFQRLQRAKKRNPDLLIVVIDPRATASCEIADIHLAIKPSSDTGLFNGLLRFLHVQQALDKDYIDAHTKGFDQTLSYAMPWSIDKVAEHCDVSEALLLRFYQGFCDANAALSLFSMGVNQSNRGVDKANAIINCHLASGQIGRPGAGPFSLTGQPNAMGGREVGGLSNMLAAHMDIENPMHRQQVQSFWGSPLMASTHGLKAIDLFDSMALGKIKVIWIMATNPVVSMPNRHRIERALKECPCVIVSDVVEDNDTMAFAHVKLPATGWSEKDGTVTNSERMISRQRGLMPPYAQSRHDWQIVCDVAQKMGFREGFNYQTSAEIFDEHARLTALNNNGDRDLDLSALMGMTSQAYDRLQPVQWPVTPTAPQGTKRLFTDGRFFTPDGKATFIPVEPYSAEQQTCADFPLVLNTGRQRDQWHTMTRTGKSPRLLEHTGEAFIAVHPSTAERYGLLDMQLVAITSKVNADMPVIVRCHYDTHMRKGECFMPIHWSLQQTNSVALTRLFTSASDPISGQPELKHAAINCESIQFGSYVNVVSRAALPRHFLQVFDYWSVKRAQDACIYRLAHSGPISEVTNLFNSLPSGDVKLLSRNAQRNRLTMMLDDTDALLLFWHATEQDLPIQETWLIDCLTNKTLSDKRLTALLRNQPEDEFLLGRQICSCFNVHENAIVEQVLAGVDSVAKLGTLLKCGTNCGSCQSELSQIIRDTRGKTSIENTLTVCTSGERIVATDDSEFAYDSREPSAILEMATADIKDVTK